MDRQYLIPGLVLALSLLAGCATTGEHHLMATPVIYKDARLDFAATLPKKLQSTQATVFYATRRTQVAAGELGNYGDGESASVELGVAQVGLGEPGWTFDQLQDSDLTGTVENPRPGRVERIEVLGPGATTPARSAAERAFIARINAVIANTANSEVVLYVHGYRVSFDEVAVTMGSLSAYLGFGATVAFQWPTGQMFWNYLTDCPRAERYIPDIERLITLLAETRAGFINMMAYSCGSPLLAEALARLRERYPDDDRAALARRFRIGSVIFAASDIDLKTFARAHVPPILDMAKQAIIYMSRRDAALGFSSFIAGASRLGRPDIDDLTTTDIEVLTKDPRLQGVDVTDVRGAHEMGGMRGHGYWYANEWIATDVLLSLRYPIPPEKRCLVPISPGARIWRIPETYPDCVTGQLLKVYPELRRSAN